MQKRAMAAQIMATVNQKGGQSKTVTTYHVGEAARVEKKRLLLVDDDKQGSLSLLHPRVAGAAPGLLSKHLYETELPSNLQPEVLDDTTAIIRADGEWDGATPENRKNFADNLRKLVEVHGYELVLIDTPGALNERVAAALIAATVVICPVSVGLLEMAGLAKLWGYINAIKTKGLNTKLRVMGMLPSKVNPKSPEEAEGLDFLRNQYGNAILPHVLYERASVKQSIARRKPVWIGTKGAGHLTAAREWKVACNFILKNLGVI